AGGFPALVQVYRGMEDAGRVLRGRFVDGMGGAQFAERGLVDALRTVADAQHADAPGMSVGLSAVDPANPFGPVLPWPAHRATLRPVRRAGALVVLGGGRLRLYLAQGGRQLLTWFDPDAPASEAAMVAAAQALGIALRRSRRSPFTLELIDDAPVKRDALSEALRATGFSRAPKGLDWNG
ncbi:MAG: Lhr family helicase, partial [Stenotrophomonas sp.]